MEIRGNGIHRLKITPGVIKKYLKKFNVSTEQLDRSKVRVLFLGVVKDFLDEKLKTDDLTYISTQIFYEIKKPDWFNYDNELFKALSDASEATWYKLKNKERYNEMLEFLKKFYEDNKRLLSS